MTEAISLAMLAMGHVSPNPAVGCVIVKNGAVVGKGYTQPPGSAHAEIVALTEAGELAKGATLYTTLEPCCHYGRTPSCTKAVINAGIKEVHAAMLDPNPVVCGKGKEELETAGIKVILGECAEQAADITAAYTKYITTGEPFITAKFAMSLDGKIATRTGDSKWISSEESRRFVHYLRYTSDAILVGVNTILVDDPQLTYRLCTRGGIAKRQPLRIILDTLGQTPVTSRIFHEPGSVLMAVGDEIAPAQKKAYLKAGAEVMVLPSKRGLVDLAALFKSLGARQIASVLVEGGSTVLGSLFDAGLVDKVFAFIAPTIIGGKTAVTAVGGKGTAEMIDAIKLEQVNTRLFNGDFMVCGHVRKT
ncbi:MAG: bifunctional diaminohydroxyphosphoribosylaminopyrimidine deaminase/5-amino-6-(5-phosphoribosylamino)uracil reductase RibD [Dehalococcoidales bacterium]|nr:bifunctional diaminohydroxyphosphoribosylaminopyrimidine deaminase/5-amino-6-(5-phosphoribosylamino)uracil reductase RibD [Dehalococcoidales bacterium]